MSVPRGYEPRDFHPAPGLGNPHAQTLVGRWVRRPPRHLPFRRHRLPTPDGDVLDVDFWAPGGPTVSSPSRAADDPLVLVLHGLEGCSRSGYVVESCRRLAARGIRAVALNFRGCGGAPNRKPRFYHSGETGDLDHTLRWLAERWPAAPTGVLGFSLGGNVLLKYLGERDRAPHGPRAAAAVSVPVDLSESARRMESGLGLLYGRFFLRSLRRKVRRKARRFPGAFDLGAVSAAATIRAFDDAVTAPLHGFRDAAHYYRESSARRYLGGVSVPTLLVHAADDPLAPASTLPASTLRDHPWILPHVTESGGHVGFLEWRRGAPAPWVESELTRYFTAQLLDRA